MVIEDNAEHSTTSDWWEQGVAYRKGERACRSSASRLSRRTISSKAVIVDAGHILPIYVTTRKETCRESPKLTMHFKVDRQPRGGNSKVAASIRLGNLPNMRAEVVT